MIISSRITKETQDAYRRNCAYLKVIFDMLDGLEYHVPGGDPNAKFKLDKRYYREMQIMGYVTNRDYIQIADKLIVRLDYLPRNDCGDLVYRFHFLLCAGYTELGVVTGLDIGEDWGLITAEGGNNIILNLMDPEFGYITHTPMYELIEQYKLLESGLTYPPKEVPPDRPNTYQMYMAYNGIARAHNKDVREGDKSIRINVGGISMPFDAWRKRLNVDRETLAEILTITYNQQIDQPKIASGTDIGSDNNRTYEVRGTYRTLAEWSKYAHISKKMLKERLASGMTMEEAITKPVEGRSIYVEYGKKRRYYTFKGETKTFKEWAQILGISTAMFAKRVDEGLPPRKVMKPAPRHKVIYAKDGEYKEPVRKPGYLVADRLKEVCDRHQRIDKERVEALYAEETTDDT